MQLLGVTSYICLALYAVCIALPARKVILVYVVAAAFTTTAALNAGGSSILVYQPIWLILAIKVALLSHKSGIPATKPFLAYLGFALVSTFLALLNTDVWVYNTDSVYAQVRFSSQQYTQWAYMLIAISTAWCTAHLVRLGEVSVERLMHVLDVTMIIVILIAFLQLVVPVDIINEYLRNSVHANYTRAGARISATFQEPSMLSLYLVPLMGVHAVRLTDAPNIKSAVLLGLSLVVCLLNRSSAAFLGLIVVILFVCARQLFFRRKISHTVILTFIVAIATLFVMTWCGVFDQVFAGLINKMSGNGVSGEERLASVTETFSVFLAHPLFGVGWGTVRAAFLFDMLAETGIVGFVLFAVPLIRVFRNLSRGTSLDQQCLCYLLVAAVILSIVSSEIFYPSLWIFVGIGMSCSLEDPRKSNGQESGCVSQCAV